MEAKRLLLLSVLLAAVGGALVGLMPGSLVSVSRSDRALQQVVLGAAHSYNNQSNDAFLFRPSSIRRAQRQVVRGLRFLVDFAISRTVCRKGGSSSLTDCSFQPAGRLQQTLHCHLDVWMVEWMNQTKTLKLHCGP